MDVGIFKVSKIRMIAWVVIPPVLITAVGLSSYALRQRAEWRMQQAQALSDVLPAVIGAQASVRQLFEDLGLSEEKRIESRDQLISLLQEKAVQRDITFDTVQVVRRDKSKGSDIPVLRATVEAFGDVSAFQLYLNDIKLAQPLLTASSINIVQRTDDGGGGGNFELKVVFDLLLVDEVLKASGGSQ
jgi:hypothetical protein